MRGLILTIGLLLLLIGVFIVNQGPQSLAPIAERLGFGSNVQTETRVIAPTLVPVAPSNYSFLTVDLTGRVQTEGTLTVTDGREVAFYVMNEGNFSEWRIGKPSTVMLAKPLAVSYNFTFTPTNDGTYFFVFDNQDNSRRTVIFSLSTIQNHIVLTPVAQYAGYEVFLIGIVLTVLGAKTGVKRKRIKLPEARATATGWSCRYCDATNPSDQAFCAKCGRSRN